MDSLLSKRQVAALLGIHPLSVNRMVRQQRFPAPLKLSSGEGGHCRWPESVVRRWLDERKAEAGSQAAR